MVLELCERSELGLYGMPPVTDKVAFQFQVAEIFDFVYEWLWGDSLWTLNARWGHLTLRRLPQSQYKDPYYNKTVWESLSGSSRSIAHYEFARIFHPDFLQTCENLGYEPPWEEPKKPLSPIVRRLKTYTWNLLHENEAYIATLSDHFEPALISRPQANLRIKQLKLNNSLQETIVDDRFDRKTRDHLFTMFATGKLDEVRMAAAL